MSLHSPNQSNQPGHNTSDPVCPRQVNLQKFTLDRNYLAAALDRMGVARGVKISADQNPDLLELAAAIEIATACVTSLNSWLTPDIKPGSPPVCDADNLQLPLRLAIQEIIQNIVAYDMLGLTTDEKGGGVYDNKNALAAITQKWRDMPKETVIRVSLDVADHQLILTIRGNTIIPVQKLIDFWAHQQTGEDLFNTITATAQSFGGGGQGFAQIKSHFPLLTQKQGERRYQAPFAHLFEESELSRVRGAA